MSSQSEDGGDEPEDARYRNPPKFHGIEEPSRQEPEEQREPDDGESYDQNGNIRPVPPHVPNHPEEEDG